MNSKVNIGDLHGEVGGQCSARPAPMKLLRTLLSRCDESDWIGLNWGYSSRQRLRHAQLSKLYRGTGHGG